MKRKGSRRRAMRWRARSATLGAGEAACAGELEDMGASQRLNGRTVYNAGKDIDPRLAPKTGARTWATRHKEATPPLSPPAWRRPGGDRRSAPARRKSAGHAGSRRRARG